MKRSLILGVTLVAVLLLFSFVTPSMANDAEHKIEDESEQELITEQITMVCYSAPPVEVEPVVVSEPPEIEENDEAYDGIEEESKEEETYITHYTEDDIIMLAKLLYNECRGVDSVTEQACVVWTVLNRVDHGGISIAEAVIQCVWAVFYGRILKPFTMVVTEPIRIPLVSVIMYFMIIWMEKKICFP